MKGVDENQPSTSANASKINAFDDGNDKMLFDSAEKTELLEDGNNEIIFETAQDLNSRNQIIQSATPKEIEHKRNLAKIRQLDCKNSNRMKERIDDMFMK